MEIPSFEDLPEDWKTSLDELKESCEWLPEDEDRLIREGRARFKALSPGAQAALTSRFDELFERMQEPGSQIGVDQAFRRAAGPTR